MACSRDVTVRTNNNTSDVTACKGRTRVHGQWFIFIYTSFLAVSV